MDDAITYSIHTTGNIIPGFDETQVAANFAALFKVTPEKAKGIVSSQMKIKAGLDQTQAERYQKKLQQIGLAVEARSSAPEPASELILQPVPGASEEPALEPIAEQAIETPLEPMEPASSGEAGVQLDSHTSSIDGLSLEMTGFETEAPAGEQSETTHGNALMICPKCGLSQPKAEQCSGCGVFVHKVAADGAKGVEEAGFGSEKDSGQVENAMDGAMYIQPGDELPVRAIGVAAAGALAGALLWMLVVVKFDYEIGLIAWFIGGVVGGGAAIAGARGQAAGVVCGVLALLAIFGGKYLAYQSIQQQLVGNLGSEQIDISELQQYYKEDQELANYYVQTVDDDYKLQEFMIDNYYTEAISPAYVTAEEVQWFKDVEHQYLVDLSAGFTSFEEWNERWHENVAQAMGEISTFALVKESLGLVDIVFMFLGIGTAFQLGRGKSA